CIIGFGLLTVRCVRDIRSLSSWRPASAGNWYRAKLSQNPASMGLLGQNGLIISGSVLKVDSMTRGYLCNAYCRISARGTDTSSLYAYSAGERMDTHG